MDTPRDSAGKEAPAICGYALFRSAKECYRMLRSDSGFGQKPRHLTSITENTAFCRQ